VKLKVKYVPYMRSFLYLTATGYCLLPAYLWYIVAHRVDYAHVQQSRGAKWRTVVCHIK